MFDLIIFPLSLDAGREHYDLPGLLVAAAPRKAARMRSQDQLVLYCKLQSTTSNSSGVSTAQLKEILSRLADTYFSFSGSVTAGLRAVTGRLNDFLFTRNSKGGQEGQTIGVLNLAVIHGERLVVAHAGATHSFVLSKNQVLHFDDGQAGRGLGLSRTAIPRFYQAALDAGDILVVCADPPSSWTPKSLANNPLSFDHLRRRLLSEAGDDLKAGVIRFQDGKGQISYWRPGEAPRPTGRTASRPAPRPVRGEAAARSAISADRQPAESVSSEPVAEAGRPETHPVLFMDEAKTPAQPAQPVTPPSELPGNMASLAAEADLPASAPDPAIEENGVVAETPGVSTGASAPQNETGLETPPISSLPPVRPESLQRENLSPVAGQLLPVEAKGTRPARQAAQITTAADAAAGQPAQRVQMRGQNKPRVARPPRQGPGAFRKGLTALGLFIKLALQKVSPAWRKAGGAVSAGTARVIPRKLDADGRPEPFFNLSPAQMLAIAVIVPLVVVTIAATMYFKSGRAEQFQWLFLKAQQYAQQAEQQKDPVQQREGWKLTYATLQEADSYGDSSEAQALKQKALGALDGLEGIVRLHYQPATSSPFPAEVKITRIAATLNDVYLLDSSQGRILRLYRTASGYEVDPKFNCGPGQAGTVIVNPLIDMAALPPNNDMSSTVMGIDAGGNLVYCSPTLTGFDSRPLALPDAGWGTIVGMTLYNDTLYVLDPKTNAVYRYDGSNGVFADRPHLYFDNTIPQLKDVIDMAVDQEFLYLLHSDGRMTVCDSGGFAYAETKCTDPTPYGDSRPGYDPAPLTFVGTHLIHVQTTQPPDPSLFTLDAANKSIYHLSLHRLNFQRQYRATPNEDFPLPNGSPTAFAIAPNRRALLAFGNQVFFATIP